MKIKDYETIFLLTIFLIFLKQVIEPFPKAGLS